MAEKSFKTFIWAESGLSRASKTLPEMQRPDHDFGPRRMLADSVAEQGLNFSVHETPPDGQAAGLKIFQNLVGNSIKTHELS